MFALHSNALQVDALVPGLLGGNRTVFASAYCNRREVPRPGKRWHRCCLPTGSEQE